MHAFDPLLPSAAVRRTNVTATMLWFSSSSVYFSVRTPISGRLSSISLSLAFVTVLCQGHGLEAQNFSLLLPSCIYLPHHALSHQIKKSLQDYSVMIFESCAHDVHSITIIWWCTLCIIKWKWICKARGVREHQGTYYESLFWTQNMTHLLHMKIKNHGSHYFLKQNDRLFIKFWAKLVQVWF